MSILYWLLLGLIAGALASFVMKGGFGILGDIVVGILGALLGGWVFNHFFQQGVAMNQFNLMNILVAFFGACILIALARAIAPRGRTRR